MCILTDLVQFFADEILDLTRGSESTKKQELELLSCTSTVLRVMHVVLESKMSKTGRHLSIPKKLADENR